MVKYSRVEEKVIYRALADPIRRAIIKQLQHKATTVSNLAKHYSISLPAVSKHLKVLEKAGLVRQAKLGQMRLYRLDRQHLHHFYNSVRRLVRQDRL